MLHAPAGSGPHTKFLTGSEVFYDGRAKIQVRRLSMSRGTETGDVNLKVDEVQ